MNGNENCRLLILDCDGVLIRSEPANLAFYNHIFAHFGLPTVAEDDRQRLSLLHTLSTPQVIDAFFPPSQRPAVRAWAAELSYEPFAALVQPEPGWKQVLSQWREGGGCCSVATNRGVSAHVVLEAVGLDALMDEVVTIKDVARPKPHPDMLLEVLERYGARPDESLYVGDSALDRQAAAEAGIAFLGFRHPEPPSVDSAAQVELHLRRVAPHRFSATLHTAES